MGDFNAHHKNWNCNNNDTNGERLLHSFNNSNMILHNYKSITYVQFHNNTKSNLDLIFSSSNISDKVNVKVKDETWGSDHFPISIEINLEKSIYYKKSFKLKSIRTNWPEVYTNLEENYTQFMTIKYDQSTASDKYSIFVNCVTNAIKLHTPKKRTVANKIHINPVPWWDPECDKAKRLRKAAFKRWQYTAKPEDYTEYKKLSSQAIKTFKKKKSDHFKKFAESIKFNVSKKYVWNTTKILKHKWAKIIPPHSSDNHQGQDKINEALDKISPPWCCTNPEWLPNCNENEFLSSSFNFMEFNIALDSRNMCSAPGIDGIDYEIIQKLPIKYKLILVDIFNEMYESGIATHQNGKSHTCISLVKQMGRMLDLFPYHHVYVNSLKQC